MAEDNWAETKAAWRRLKVAWRELMFSYRYRIGIEILVIGLRLTKRKP